MARPIVLSNGSLHVGINRFGLVHDFYFPYVGHENHTIGRGLRHRIGIWIDGRLSWLDDGEWTHAFSYPHDALIGHCVAEHRGLGVRLEFDDAVDSDKDAFLRSIHVVNLDDKPREIRLFLHQAFVIGDSRGNTDTACYLPDSDALLHYRGRRVCIISSRHDEQPFDQFTTGLFGIEGKEGTWRDAEDGELSGCVVEHGRVDSIVRHSLVLDAHASTRVEYWIAVGTTLRDALQAHNFLRREPTLSPRFDATARAWHAWLEPALEYADLAPEEHRHQFITSTLMIKAHMDKRGAIIASTDSAALNYDRDAYAYSWPRDGAYAIWPLIRMGYQNEALQFFNFCRKGLHPAGYLSHKYRADGAIGSSWHPYLHPNGDVAPPIQEDETALVLFMFAQYYWLHPEKKILDEYYESFVVPMADFLAKFIDAETKLPLASYDLWEEVRGVSTYTTAVTQAALMTAADLAEAKHDDKRAVQWRLVATDMYEAARRRLYDDERGALLKRLWYDADGAFQRDQTIDASAVFGAFIFGLFTFDDPELGAAFDTLISTLGHEGVPALPRYEHDTYRQRDEQPNFWHITTLWRAQMELERGNVDAASTGIAWVASHSFDSGVLAEQIVPSSGFSTSVAPLTWSHAEYVTTLLDWMQQGDAS